MGLLNKIGLSLANRGLLKLKDWQDKFGDDEEFVEACIEGRGIEEFQYAGSWLKSDAKFILKMVRKHPKILQYCDDIIYDRYFGSDCLFEEREVDPLLFAAMCCDENINAFKYISEDSSRQYLDCVQHSTSVKGEFQGEQINIELNNEKDWFDVLLYIRHDIVKCGLIK